MEQVQVSQLRQWKKIWEIDGCYKCSLIGTCLNRAELRKLSRDRVFAVDSGCDDYQLHAHFIRISDQSDVKGKTLHRYLERKYRAATKKYRRVTTEKAITALWDEDFAAGRLDSAWWAVITHPCASRELIGRLYSHLHMLGHDFVNSYHKDRTLIVNLRAKVAMLEEVLGSERQYHRHEKRQFQKERAELEKENSNRMTVIQTNQALCSEIDQLKGQIQDLTSKRQEEPDQQMIAELRQHNNALCGRIDQMTDEMGTLKDQLASAFNAMKEIKGLQTRLEKHGLDQAREIASLENILVQHIAKDTPCLTCSDQNTANCPGVNLCGKAVLYVGGLHKMVPHYRRMVEQLGGTFMHHDGGKEASRNLLPKMLVTADAVFCPVDRVSHDACTCVKKMCKRYQKPFVMMRSSGLSSLAKGLCDIVQ